jgi:hypothetical protein
MKKAHPKDFAALATDLAKDSIVTRALARWIEQIIEEIHTSHIKPVKAENARLKAALTRIKYINHGPDQASGEWRCMEAAAIADAALQEPAP